MDAIRLQPSLFPCVKFPISIRSACSRQEFTAASQAVIRGRRGSGSERRDRNPATASVAAMALELFDTSTESAAARDRVAPLLGADSTRAHAFG